jgi:hypothetical protein
MSNNIFNTSSECEITINNKTFGISDIDSSPKRPCVIDENLNNKENWGVSITNKDNKKLTINGIDCCISILKEDNTKDNICDACIRYDNTIIFIEIKDKARNWFEQAAQQLISTIKHFEKENALITYTTKHAYIANKKRPHAHVNHNQILQKILYEHKFIVRISQKIDII